MRAAGFFLGTAVGDALGLPAEGLSGPAAALLFRDGLRFRLLGRAGFVSDDTEQSALLAQAIIRHPSDVAACVRSFRRSLLGWFLRLPWGIGFATLRASVRIALGLRRTGVCSAGNGAAMRAGVIGLAFPRDRARRQALGRLIAETTHTDPRAIEGALFVAELARECACVASAVVDRHALVERARAVVKDPSLAAALTKAAALARAGVDDDAAAARLGTTGFVVHTLGFAAWCFLAHGDTPLGAIGVAIGHGGDADTIGAIVGGWVGALHGEQALPAALVARVNDGPFGPTHLVALGAAVDAVARGEPAEAPPWSAARALFRNLALFPVILAHGLLRLLPSRR